MTWQTCVKCGAYFRHRRHQGLCFECWLERNPTIPATQTPRRFR